MLPTRGPDVSIKESAAVITASAAPAPAGVVSVAVTAGIAGDAASWTASRSRNEGILQMAVPTIDALARALAADGSRRNALKLLTGALIAGGIVSVNHDSASAGPVAGRSGALAGIIVNAAPAGVAMAAAAFGTKAQWAPTKRKEAWDP